MSYAAFLQQKQCLNGHTETRDSAPIFSDTCVNVEHFCVRCERNIAVTSWTRDAWDKKAARNLRVAASLRTQGSLDFKTAASCAALE